MNVLRRGCGAYVVLCGDIGNERSDPDQSLEADVGNSADDIVHGSHLGQLDVGRCCDVLRDPSVVVTPAL